MLQNLETPLNPHHDITLQSPLKTALVSWMPWFTPVSSTALNRCSVVVIFFVFCLIKQIEERQDLVHIDEGGVLVAQCNFFSSEAHCKVIVLQTGRKRPCVWLQGECGKMTKTEWEQERGKNTEAFLVDECVSGLHVVLVNDGCICQPRSCGATISQPAEERSDGWKRGGETERGKYGALDAEKKVK